MAQNRQWRFNKRPKKDIETDTLVLEDAPMPTPQDGQFLVRTIYMSMDATNRLWLGDWDMYMDPIPLGQPMMGFALGEIVESHNPAFPVGALTVGLMPWAEYSVHDGTGFSVMPNIPGLNLAEAFGILGIAGPTALYGLMDVGRPKKGDAVVVTAAAGAVGMLVGQIARIHGCRTIGVAGGEEKCRWLTEEFGYDHAIDYKRENVLERLRELAPEGVDVHFENVGGDMLDAGLTVMKNFGSVVICGLISTYNTTAGDKTPGPYMFRNLIMRRLRVEGFVILDQAHRYPEFHQQLATWMLEGRLRARLHVEPGIERATEALKMLYTGANTGKLMVAFGREP